MPVFREVLAMSFFVMAAFIGIVRYGRVLSLGTLYHATVNSIPGGLAHVNRGVVTWTNMRLPRMLGFGDRALAGRMIDELLPSVPGIGNGANAFLARSVGRSYMVNTAPLDPADPGKNVLYVIVDVTEREKAAEELGRLVEEKEILFRELQHRVKNNLTLIESYIGLGIGGTSDETARRVLSETRARVHTISAIYEQLYRAGGGATVDMPVYLAEIAKSAAGAFQGAEGGVTVAVDAEDIAIDMKRAAHLGIIANELITNSFKHAYSPGQAGTVRLSLGRSAGEAVLSVSDDGKGFPREPQAGNGGGMGLKLVELLAKQMGGAFLVDGKNGMTVRVTLPLGPENEA